MNSLKTVTVLFLCGLVMASCDLTVTNPGPTDDAALDNVGAHEALVNGMSYSFARALGDLAYIGSEPSQEITGSGRVHPVKLPLNPGQLVDNEVNRQWALSHEARWTAEDGVERLERVLEGEFQSNSNAAKALLFAGYSNRLLGENMCYAVIDEGPAEDHEVHFDRAEAFFTRAIEVAQNSGEADVAEAAYAGRAQVRALSNNFIEAVSDAANVSDDFNWEASYTTSTSDQYNILFWTNDNNPYRAHSVWDTYYETYYETTGDPRVRWGTDEGNPVGEFENIPWYFQQKYPNRDSNISMSKGAEMRLIEAEFELLQGNWQVGMDIINSLRAGVISDLDNNPIPEWSADNAEEAWTSLKRERGIVLWLEARRLGDLRRWTNNNTPGEMEDMSANSICFPVSENEKRSNPNIDL